MTQRHWISEQESDALFADYVTAIAAQLGLSCCNDEQAVCDTFTEHGLVSRAVSTTDKFAAYRASVAGGVVDIACISTGDGLVRLLLSELQPSLNTSKFSELLQGLAPTLRPAQRALPSFVELAAMLASKGGLSSTSADQAAEIADLSQELDYYRETVQELSDELRQLKAQLRGKSTHLDAARFSGKDSEDAQDDAVSTEERTLADVPAWCAENTERITVLPRAINGCKKGLYEEPAALFAGLEFLAGAYRQARLGTLSKDEMQAALERTGLRLSGSTTGTVAGSQGDAYFVTWQGQRRFMDLHLLKGGGRDERYCLRIYFFWCEDTERVVVGSMPAHLSNSLS